MVTNVSAGNRRKPEVRCSRFNQNGHGCGNCHLLCLFRKPLRLGSRQGQTGRPITPVVGDPNRGIGAMAPKTVVRRERDKVDVEEDIELRMAESEWINKYNMDISQTAPCTSSTKSATAVYRGTASQSGSENAKSVCALSDRGATTTVVGKSRMMANGLSNEFRRREPTTRKFRFGESRFPTILGGYFCDPCYC